VASQIGSRKSVIAFGVNFFRTCLMRADAGGAWGDPGQISRGRGILDEAPVLAVDVGEDDADRPLAIGTTS